MENIENNLYRFYHQLTMAESVKGIRENGYEVAVAENDFWPRIIFNLDYSIEPEKLIPQIAAGFSEKNYTSFFIASDRFITRNHSSVLKENRIMPIKILKGMILSPEKKYEIETPSDIQIAELKDYTQFVNFSNLVNSELMASEMLFSPKLLTDINGCEKIKLFGLFSSKKLVSTLMVYTEPTNAGLYFIATKKAFQKNGYASILIKFVVNNLVGSGIKEVVLHANNFATGIYKKLGFEHKIDFVIYKML